MRSRPPRTKESFWCKWKAAFKKSKDPIIEPTPNWRLQDLPGTSRGTSGPGDESSRAGRLFSHVLTSRFSGWEQPRAGWRKPTGFSSLCKHFQEWRRELWLGGRSSVCRCCVLPLAVLRLEPSLSVQHQPSPAAVLGGKPLRGSIRGVKMMPRFPPTPPVQGESGERGENGSWPSQKGPISQQTALVPCPSKVAQKIKGQQSGLEGPGEVVYIYLTRKLIDKQTTWCLHSRKENTWFCLWVDKPISLIFFFFLFFFSWWLKYTLCAALCSSHIGNSNKALMSPSFNRMLFSSKRRTEAILCF